MQNRRVVVTGLGIISPVGNSIDAAWRAILAGTTGVRMIDDYDTSEFTSKFAGLVSNFDVTKYMSAKEARRIDGFIQYGIAAGMESIEDSGILDDAKLDKSRVGLILGSGIGGIGTIQATGETFIKSGPRKISPFFIPATIINMLSGNLSIKYGFTGPNLAIVTACTTGTHCIGIAARSIAAGDADVIVAGGAEKASTQLGMGGFAAARALSSRNDSPATASRPWDKDRDGFVLGDGAGSLVLEEYEHAKKRGAKIYAELTGFGMSGDAFHITRPSGAGAIAAMNNALQDAGITPDKVDYINAHGTSTPIGDVEEVKSVRSVFGDHADKLAISSTKSMTGHLLGATGAVEAIFSILAMRDNIAPPTINLDQPGEGCDLDFVANVAREMPINCVLSNSFGFGGTNGTLIFSKLD